MSKNLQEAFLNTREAGTIASGALDEITQIIKPGITKNVSWLNKKGLVKSIPV